VDVKIPKPGDRGEHVKVLQRRLLELGHPLPQWGADGIYSWTGETAAAVRNWQEEYHVDGTLDADEWMAMLPPNEGAPLNKPEPLDGQKAIVAEYGEPWLDVQGWWKRYGAPADIGDAYRHIAKRGKIWVNRDIVGTVQSVFGKIAAAGMAEEIQSYDGCFSVRRKRGYADNWSVHTWALAIDINAATNALGTEPTLREEIVRAFTSEGWTWGGAWSRPDGMHFQYARGI